ncbi:hypothetical protein NBRC111893_1609 [Lentilactobacillus kosonis]|uniref:Uncharacterized protein n=1 Tax=Lentilactobacillus kosonis TaxID=2810561 RepID=A0A401FM88_9LACO|nr:hypothetical protein NBRC111893_1609 [Lentilactobacillus kosonis]
MNYINLACMFLSFGLLTIFALHPMLVIPLVFLGLTIFCFWLAYWDNYDKKNNQNNKK